MFYINSIKLLLCLCVGSHICRAKKYESHNERTKKMNTTQSIWLSSVKTLKSGHLTAIDATEVPVILDWKITDILSPELAEFKKSVSSLAAETHARSEVQFLRANPEAVSQDGFLKACIPFFEKETIDWKKVEETIYTTYKQFYMMDVAQFGADIINRIANDRYFFVTVKEVSSAKIIGFIMTSITPALPFGDVKLIKVAIVPTEQDRGLDRLLISSLFKVIPQVRRIFTSIRPTDKRVLEAYLAYGFERDHNPVEDPQHPINLDYVSVLEYKTDSSTVLQETAETLAD